MTLDALRARVLADEALQMELARIEEPERLAARLATLDPAIDRAALAAALAPDPLGLFGPPPAIAPGWPSRHWLPVQAAGASVDWAHFAAEPLAEPFFIESARRASARPFNRLFRQATTLDAFVAGAAEEGSLVPDGFIFHMSRCGSTLVAQMLAALPGSVAVSEAQPIAAAAGSGSAPVLRAMTAAFGRRRTGDEHRYFIKLDFRAALALPLFREAFPEIPWLFLYRDPVEVMVSQMQMPGLLAPPGGAEEDHWAESLAAVCTAALAALGEGGGLAVDYADLPGAIVPILRHFGVDPGPEGRARMQAASRRNAKAPSTPFVADGEAKRRAASEAVRAAAAAHLDAPYRRLRSLGRPF
jgi:hypothetical protein